MGKPYEARINSLYNVLELADISPMVMAEQQRDGLLGESSNPVAVQSTVSIDEDVHQKRDI
jgi:hypothetical protein